MKIAINKIRIADRLRKEVIEIDELADNIRQHGLISPIAVMEIDDDNYQYHLLAGLRRIRAMEQIGETEIEVNVLTPSDAEEMLRIEYSENEFRKEFTYSEKMDYSKQIDIIEKAKSAERMFAGKSDPMDDRPQGTSRDAIGKEIGMSGKQYDRAKYVAENATPEMIEELDNGKRTISGTYDELKGKDKKKRLSAKEIDKLIYMNEYMEKLIHKADEDIAEIKKTSDMWYKLYEREMKLAIDLKVQLEFANERIIELEEMLNV